MVSILRRHSVAICILIGGAAILSAPLWYNDSALARGAPVRISTTNPELAITNLNSQISSAQQLLDKNPERFEFRKLLFKLLVTRSQFLGDYGDFSRLKNLTKPSPSSLDEILLRAKYFTVIHQFDDAEKMLVAAKQLAPENKEIKNQSVTIRIARRDNLADLRKTQLEELKLSRSYGNLILLSAIESELGNFEVADNYLEEAITSFRDTSPFPIAYLYFQRGLMWSEKAGNIARGQMYYQEAVHYLPQFVVGEVHLAETERVSSNISQAIFRLKTVATSKDPEARGLLSDLLRDSGNKKEAATYLRSATDDYNELLAAYPLAFADHGAEFFSGPGADPTRALQLAKLNLTNRKSERAYLVAIKAARAAGAKSDLCTFVSEASELKPVFVPLIELTHSASAECA